MATNSTRRHKPSAILTAIPEAQILNPVPLKLIAGGKEYDILPMPDSALMHVGRALGTATGIIDSLLDMVVQVRDRRAEAALEDGDVEGAAVAAALRPDQVLTTSDYLGLIPELVQALLPCATIVIAGCLRLPEQEVADNFRLHEKLDALRLIILAENVPLILKNWAALTGAFTAQLPAAQQQETPAKPA